MVLWHLNAIFTFVFLNKFVILHMCGEMKVNVAHFYVSVHVCVLWCVFCLLLYLMS